MLLLAWLIFDAHVQQSSLEGDELVHVVLAEQLARGSYSLRGTPILRAPGFSHYLYDRAVYHNPPLYDAVLLGVRELFGRTSYIYLSLLASALSACLVYRLTRRHASVSGAVFATLVFLGCPIVYLVSTRIWAEALLGLALCCVMSLCETPRARMRVTAASLTLAAAALIKASTLFVLPGVLLFRFRQRKHALVIAVAPIIVSAAWLAYVYVMNQLQPPAAALVDDRLANKFVAEQVSKPALSLFYLPFVLNPGYAFALLAWQRGKELAPYALAVLGVMLGYSLLAWFAGGSYHTKYLGAVVALLAVLAGVGFDQLAAAMSSKRRRLVKSAAACVVLSILLFENTIHRRVWVPEVDPTLYWPK